MSVARVNLPREAKRGEIIELKIAIRHPMETGFRYDLFGKAIPKNVVNSLICSFNGKPIFRAEMGSGVAANPYMEFHALADTSGEFLFEWVDDEGARGLERASIVVRD